MNAGTRLLYPLLRNRAPTTRTYITAAVLAGHAVEWTLRPRFVPAIGRPRRIPTRCSMSGNRGKTRLVIPDRDRRLLSEIGIMRIIDRDLARKVAGFGSLTRVNTRLLKLTRAGLLNRFFIGTIAGGRKAIYTLSPKGGILINAENRPISRSH